MVFIRINWTLWTLVLDTVGIYNICKIHILNYLKINTMKKLVTLLAFSFIPLVSFGQIMIEPKNKENSEIDITKFEENVISVRLGGRLGAKFYINYGPRKKNLIGRTVSAPFKVRKKTKIYDGKILIKIQDSDDLISYFIKYGYKYEGTNTKSYTNQSNRQVNTSSNLTFINEPANYIVLIIGQSNTHHGRGFDSELDKPIKNIKQLGRFGNDNMQIIPAIEPLHHHTPDRDKIGFSLTFSKMLKDYLNTEKNIILVPCGFGGTGFRANNWNKDDVLYSDAVYRVKYILENYPDSELLAVLWHQGESDLGSLSYEKDLDNFIVDLRNDLNAFDVPFILGGMVPFWVDELKERQQLQEIISNTLFRHNLIGYANPEFPFRIQKEDNLFDKAHFDAKGQRELGKRYFNEYLRLKNSKN